MPKRVPGPCLFPGAVWCGTLTTYATRRCRADPCFEAQRAYTECRRAGVPWIGDAPRTLVLKPGQKFIIAEPVRERNADQPWREQAECKGMDPNIFFPDCGAGVQAALDICDRCLVREDCLDHSLEAIEDKGIWGGRSERERRVLRRQRRMAVA